VVLKFKVGTSIVAQSSLNLDHPLLRNNPAVRLLVTHDFGSAATGAFNDSALGVFYQANSAKSGDWFVTNENRTNLTATSSGGFNVMIAPAVRASATAARADGGFTFLSVAKKKPEARLLITHMVNPFPATTPYGLYLPKNIGVRYFEGPLAKRTHDVWAVFNEDLSSAIAAAYNVLDVTAHPHSSIQTSSSGNTSGNHMALDDPVANNNPNALIFVTHLGLDSPGSDTFDHAVGVFYDSTISRWCIYREDNATMPPNIAFVVDVFEAGSP
jgi:hypothetical protein